MSKRVHNPQSIVHGYSIYKLLQNISRSKLVLVAMVYGLSSIVFTSCNSPYTPKPKGYYKIDFPQRSYQLFDQPGYPYTFEYPVYANVVKDSTFFGEAVENPWWININFPQFNGRIYVSYKEIGKNKFENLINDAFTLSNKHSTKAYSIDDSSIATNNNIHGRFFKIGGDVATANQFFFNGFC